MYSLTICKCPPPRNHSSLISPFRIHLNYVQRSKRHYWILQDAGFLGGVGGVHILQSSYSWFNVNKNEGVVFNTFLVFRNFFLYFL